jgi:ribonuclease HI
MVTISTDGSLATKVRKKGKDQGPGGWAFVVHGTGEERSGHVSSGTNNRMELLAVIEAVKFVDPKKSVLIRTDSEYVSDAVNRGAVVKSNSDLWSVFRDLIKNRRVKVVWVIGHAGDPYNERADQLAQKSAAGQSAAVGLKTPLSHQRVCFLSIYPSGEESHGAAIVILLLRHSSSETASLHRVIPSRRAGCNLPWRKSSVTRQHQAPTKIPPPAVAVSW